MQNINLDSFVNKDAGELIKFADILITKNTEDKIHAHKIYELVLNQIQNTYNSKFSYLRGYLNQKIWECEKNFFWNEKYYSQFGQDKIIKNTFFKNVEFHNYNGFFLDIGAFDGITGSNTYYFEKVLKWRGIAVEPSPIQFSKLKLNRSCTLVNKAVDKKKSSNCEFLEVTDGFIMQSGLLTDTYKENIIPILSKHENNKTEVIKVETLTFEDVMNDNVTIDYLSIDTEGNELDILQSINFKKYKIKVISVENNDPNNNTIFEFLREKKFEYYDTLGVDLIFYNKKFFKNI